MAADNYSVNSLLNWVALTEPVAQVIAEIPKPLPAPFYKVGSRVLGDKYRQFVFRGTRQPARQSLRGAPPRSTPQTALARREAIMISSQEETTVGSEVLELFHNYTDYTVTNASIEIARRINDFGMRAGNLEIACIHSAVANGYIWFDAEGEVLPTSAGASLTVDYQIPAGNRVAAAASWATTSTDIPTLVLNFLQVATAPDGRTPTLAICGKNVVGYLSNNTSFQQYLARNPNYNQTFVNENRIADGVLNLKWVNVQNMMYERQAGTMQQDVFPADQIVFMPDPNDKAIYDLKYGSYPVPKEFVWANQQINPDTFFQNLENAYGPYQFSYGYYMPTPQIKFVSGHTVLPDLPTPTSVWYYDTTP